MTSEAYQDSPYDKRGQKRPSRPKLLKLTEVSMPHRNRKKIKTKVKERSQSNVRDRIYDDPAYTDDISHLAIPMRRSSGPDKIDESFLQQHKKKVSHKDSHFSKRTESGRYQSDGSSSSDNMPPDPGKHKRGQSLEGGGNLIERSPKKREKRDRSAKQKRNLSLDNALSNSLRRSLEKSECSLKTSSIERQKSKPKSMQRQNASESWSSCLAATSDSSKATENEEAYAERKEPTKMQIGKRFLRGEIGIKSFNYYLLKEGLKSSKKFVDKQRSSLTKADSKKPHSRSEENIYEEIFFVDKSSDAEDHSKYPDCELCMQQCTKENCEYCIEDLKNRQYFGSLGRNNGPHNLPATMVSEEIPTAPAAHILQYQSYNPNNPGVYKIETTPVAFTSDYNPIHQLQMENQKPLPQRRFSRTGSQVGGTRINTKSSSSSDSLHHKYARDQNAQDLYDCNHSMIYGAPQILGPCDQKIYKSDSKVSIISEYSVRSESSNRNFRCGEVSDSSLGDSMFSYSTQRRYFGSSESCRFAFECRRCSLDGEKCSFSDTCRYECRNCDCSSSYFSSDFDDYSRKNSTGMSNASQKSYEYYNDTIDVKQNKYAQDFIKHVNDVKRSIYQAELQRTTTPGPTDPYGTIPPPKQMDMKKSMSHYQQIRQYQQRPSRSGSSPFRIAPSSVPLPCNPSMMMKDIAVSRDNKNVSSAARTTSFSQSADKENFVKVFSSLPAEDKSLKYSEGKYAQTGTHHSANNSGRPDKKDSLERSQRKQTGAIPKLSSSSANSSHQSHRNQRGNNNGTSAAAGAKESIQRALASVPAKSPRSSPKHVQPSSKDATTKIPMRPTRADYVTTSAESKKLITLAKTEESQRTESKEQVMCQDNHNPQKTQSDGKGNPGDNGSAVKDEGDATESHPQQTKEQSRAERRTLEDQRQKAAVAKSTMPEKKSHRKLSEWSEMEEGDDDVFIDAPPAEIVDTSSVKRQKSPSPPTALQEQQQIESSLAKEEEEDKKARAKPSKEVKQPLQALADAPASSAPSEPPQASTENVKRGPPDSSKESSATSAAKETPTRATRIGKAPTLEKTKAQQSRKSTAELSMKAKQQTVEPVGAPAPVPKKADAAKGEPEEANESSPSAAKTSAAGAGATVAPRAKPTTTSAAGASTSLGTTVEPAEEALEPPDGEVHPVTSSSAAAAVAACAEEISRESDVAGATGNRDTTDKSLVEKEHKEEAIYLDANQQPSGEEIKPKTEGATRAAVQAPASKIDICDLPLPELPPKKRRNRDLLASSKFHESLSRRENDTLRDFPRNYQSYLPIKRRESFDSAIRTVSDGRKMHYHNLGHMTAATNPSSVKPTYLFGENRIPSSKKNARTDEIFLNKSGWVQVSSKRVNDENSASVHNRKSNAVRLENQNGSLKNSIRVIQIDNTTRDKPIYAVPKVTSSKIEELISRSEARRNNNTSRTYMKPGYKIIDPQIASILNERPGFLPVHTFADSESPPPVTPILSPPPAFQDSKSKYKKSSENVKIITKQQKDPKTSKGMVFSRSFEYDRKPADYAETFSKSFDSNLSDGKPLQRDKSPNFSTLTGCSPNYLTKRESSSGRSRESSPKYQKVGTAYLNAPNIEAAVYSNPKKLDKISRTSLDRNERSRRAQFSRVNPTSRFRSFDTAVNQRLNSCDSGARSDLSNDELDNEEDNSTDFLSTNYQPQSMYKQSKPRSLTPDKYDSLGSQKNLRKQRSLTPESRSLTPEDRRKKGSQASLSSRQNSSSRSNTLERKQKYEDKSHSPSRSSSSSSYSGGEHEIPSTHRRSVVKNAKTPEEHRIRRSRSLQLTERSPSRTVQSHKMVVCLGKPNNQTPFHHPIRSFPPTIRPDQIVTDPMANSRSVRSDIDKSRSFDLDYGKYGAQPVPPRLDFDKSRSFDEDYREQSNNLRYLTDTGMGRDERNALKPNMQRPAAMPRQTSPQNYGTRLCDHELTYDMLRRTLDRSPIMDFSRDYDVPKAVKSREAMKLGGNELKFLNERIYDHGLKLRNPAVHEGSYSVDRYKARETLTPESEMKSMRDSLAEERLRSGVADYIYRQPLKGQQQQVLQQHPQLQHQQRSVVDRGHHQVLAGSSTPSRGSCTASSCDFWPHCGVTNLKTSKISSVDRPNDCKPTASSISDPALANAASDEDDEGYVVVQDVAKEKTSSGAVGLSKISATRAGGSRPKYNRKSLSLIEVPRGSVVEFGHRIKSKPPIYANTGSRKLVPSSSSSSSVLFLGEREMPITRERDLQNSPTAQGCSPGHVKLGEMQNKQGPAGSNVSDFRAQRSSEHRRKAGTPSRARPFRKQRSQSLPNVLLQTQFPSTSSRDNNVKPDPFSSNLSNQIRAVSSPSLSENPELVQKSQNGCNTTEPVASDIDPYTIGQNYAGVLQKFKKTFSQLKSSGKQITPQTSASEIESGKYRFGPLIWRSSKERRKAKYNRRDKCNSGDSGIQIELENDENYVHEAPESIETSPSLVSVRVRRTNSAKTANSMTSNLSAKAKALKKIESYEHKLASTPLPTRSLSQPSGLDRMARADLDESDTDSVSSHPDLHEGHRSIYAEVLYPFTPAGPQELGLEKGSLIEVLRKDIGPWWYGRIKHDAVIAKVIEPQQGWFPKEFVRVIPPFFGPHEAEGDRRFSNDNTLESCDTRMNSTTTILPPPSSLDVSSTATKSTLLSPSQLNSQHSESLRNSVIKELLETEINYVKLLSSLCLGYLREMRKRVDIFPPDSLNLIFSNIESIWRFQQTFLDALRKGIESRRIAQVFLDHQSAFLVYSNYCNSYPRALMELETYASSKDAKCVLENCRLAERLPELPLSAHLLAPIQRICRYPLHLAELVKHTPKRQLLIAGLDENCSSHEIGDCKETLEIALAAMKKVTETVNEGKRHSEHLTRFQASFENFQGPPIAFHSTRFFMQTDATRVSPNLWNNTYTIFLFDHQLIYCKKDILKRNHYMYKGRIFLDNCRILNLPDGKLFGISLKNALRIYCESRNKWFDFCFRSASRKLRFLSTLAVERQFCGSNLFVSELVGEDDDNLSDREYHSDYDTPTNTIDRGMSAENFTSIYESEKVPESPTKLQKYSDTLPKKSRKTAKDGYEYNTGSLGRRKIGNWFRKAKSTNSTPTQSPTHHSMAAFNSDSSSQSSPALGYKPSKSKVKDPTS